VNDVFIENSGTLKKLWLVKKVKIFKSKNNKKEVLLKKRTYK